VATPIDFSQLFNQLISLIMQLLPFVIILSILPMVLKLVTGAFK
jgi:hypothetical protein